MDLVGFAFAVLLIELTPGPNMAWLVALTLTEGRRSGLAAITGIALGLALNAALSVIATSFILTQSPLLAQMISVLGASMMAFLAWRAWHDTGDTSPTVTPKRTAHRNFIAGVTINLLNPKATLFFVTVMPHFVLGGQPSYPQGFTMAAISVSIATMIHLALVLGAERARPVLTHTARATQVRRVLALGMLAVGGWFLVKGFL